MDRAPLNLNLQYLFMKNGSQLNICSRLHGVLGSRLVLPVLWARESMNIVTTNTFLKNLLKLYGVEKSEGLYCIPFDMWKFRLSFHFFFMTHPPFQKFPKKQFVFMGTLVNINENFLRGFRTERSYKLKVCISTNNELRRKFFSDSLVRFS